MCILPCLTKLQAMLEQDKVLHHPSVHLCLSFGFFLLHVALAQIPLGSKLSVEENNSWVSSNGDFAIGFFERSDEPYQYSVGVRFNSKSIPVGKQTVIWVAGADFTVGNTSYFQLMLNGDLILVDSPNGVTTWASNTSQLAVSSALLRDDGNFVLLNGEKDVVWESFDYPSDSLLPTQKFPVHRTLRAATNNAVSSYYSLYMNASGQLQLRWESNVIYWTVGNPSDSNVTAVLSSGGALQLVEQNSRPVWSAFGDDHDEYRGFRFLRLDVDGNLRMYSWMEASKSWRSVWQAVEDQCKVFATCYPRGVCVYNALGSPECQCPFQETSDPNGKCLAPTCESHSVLITYRHTFLYGIYPTNETIFSASSQLCKILCERNPACSAATFTNDGTAQCRIKTTPFLSGYSAPSQSSISFVRKCLDPLAVDPNGEISSPTQSSHRRSYTLCSPCLVGAASGTFVVFAVVQLVIGYFIYRRRKLVWKKAASAFRGYNSKGLMMLSSAEIEEITGNFGHLIGPTTYRGVLPNQQPVAIKELDVEIDERKFRVAVSKIGSIYHRNLVKLAGYCCDLNRRFLVYEYVKHGPVSKFLEDDDLSKKLTWKCRVEICLSVARAVCYLHTECREFVSHGNLNCENVVLDKSFEAKLTEFGFGFLSTEASCSGEKDVEDFGKMVLMLVTGGREASNICRWAYEEWFQECPERVLDKRLGDQVDIEVLERTLRIAFWCLQEDKRLRPSMDEVVKVLEGVLRVDPPPPPFAWERSPEGDESLQPGTEPPGDPGSTEV